MRRALACSEAEVPGGKFVGLAIAVVTCSVELRVLWCAPICELISVTARSYALSREGLRRAHLGWREIRSFLGTGPVNRAWNRTFVQITGSSMRVPPLCCVVYVATR